MQCHCLVRRAPRVTPGLGGYGRYGLLVRPTQIVHVMEYPNIIITLCLGVFIMAAYAVETLPFLPPRLRPYLNFVNACGAVAWAWSAMWIGQTNPAGGIIALLTRHATVCLAVSFCAPFACETPPEVHTQMVAPSSVKGGMVQRSYGADCHTLLLKWFLTRGR